MIVPAETSLSGHGVTLEPLSMDHAQEMRAVLSESELWRLWYTRVPEPDGAGEYIRDALAGRDAGHMLPWAVRESTSARLLGSTRYHDIVPEADRVEIGYTWYTPEWQRTHVNRACKLLLLTHAFETLGCSVVGFRTDNFNFSSQRAIEAIGAKRDGVIRRHMVRKDGSLRDTVMYSILREEWPDVQKHLHLKLERLRL
ncbi:MAG TPA: GNAT family protein [Fimbriimonadaceae bacterium]|nr:GNAT family protein [Fimbriimonadaceae bacterium]